MSDEHGLTGIVDQRNDSVFVPANVENRGCFLGCGIPRHIGLSKQRSGVLKAVPPCLAGQLEPVIKSGGMLTAFTSRLVELSKFLSADDVHDFTLCEDLGRLSRASSSYQRPGHEVLSCRDRSVIF